MIRCAVFDFDGTVVLSNDLKRDAFLAIADDVPSGRDQMEAILRNQTGDRHAILSRFAETVGIRDRLPSLLARYTSYCHDAIVACPLRAGAAFALAHMKESGLCNYINSSTPTEPLSRIVQARFPLGMFDGIYGGYGCKLSNLVAIGRVAHAARHEIVMVGDGIDDRDAAHDFGCRFIGVAGGTLSTTNDAEALVEDLVSLTTLVCKTNDGSA